MARTTVYAKLLNSDGSLCRPRVGPLETASLIAADRVSVSRTRSSVILRLKVLPPDSDSDPSMCMPTLGEMMMFAENRNCPEEVDFKVRACAPAYICLAVTPEQFAGMTA